MIARFLLDVARNCHLLLARPNPDRHRLLATYARLKTTQVGLRRLGRPRPRHARVLGRPVECLDYDALVRMFEDIFVRRVYAFTSPTDRPRIVDGGSNIGLSVLYFTWQYPGASVEAFEPDPQTFAVLKRNVEAGGSRGVRLHNAALAREEGRVDLFVDPGQPGALRMSTRPERILGRPLSVPATRLSRHVDGPVDFLKLDVEGAELDVVEELAESGKLAQVRQAVIEYHHHVGTDDDRLSRMLAILEQHHYGYEIVASAELPFARDRFQDILVCAYPRSTPSP